MAVHYESGSVKLLWARPNDGFEVEVDGDGPEEVEVVFRSERHRSVVRAYWRDGLPAHDVEERGGDDEDEPRGEPPPRKDEDDD